MAGCWLWASMHAHAVTPPPARIAAALTSWQRHSVVTRRPDPKTEPNGVVLVQGNDYVFMDMASYEETRVPRDEDWAKYLKEGTDCQLLFYNGDVISVDVPTTMELLVTQADPAVKGNTTAGANKPAILENGTEIQVPLFVNPGDIIKVDTRTDQYSGRVKE